MKHFIYIISGIPIFWYSAPFEDIYDWLLCVLCVIILTIGYEIAGRYDKPT